MTDKPYVERLGGSYVVDPKTGARKRVAGTQTPSGPVPRPADVRPTAAPAPAPSPETDEQSGKKGK